MGRVLAIFVAMLALCTAPAALGVVGGTPADPGTGDHVVALIDPTQPWHLDHINGQRLPSCAHHNDQYTGR